MTNAHRRASVAIDLHCSRGRRSFGGRNSCDSRRRVRDRVNGSLTEMSRADRVIDSPTLELELSCGKWTFRLIPPAIFIKSGATHEFHKLVPLFPCFSLFESPLVDTATSLVASSTRSLGNSAAIQPRPRSRVGNREFLLAGRQIIVPFPMRPRNRFERPVDYYGNTQPRHQEPEWKTTRHPRESLRREYEKGQSPRN